jgi:hypothetical protein
VAACMGLSWMGGPHTTIRSPALTMGGECLPRDGRSLGGVLPDVCCGKRPISQYKIALSVQGRAVGEGAKLIHRSSVRSKKAGEGYTEESLLSHHSLRVNSSLAASSLPRVCPCTCCTITCTRRRRRAALPPREKSETCVPLLSRAWWCGWCEDAHTRHACAFLLHAWLEGSAGRRAHLRPRKISLHGDVGNNGLAWGCREQRVVSTSRLASNLIFPCCRSAGAGQQRVEEP